MRLALTAASIAALPAIALAAPLTPAVVFMDAALFPKLIMLGLLGTVVATAVICAKKLLAGPHLAGGSAFVSGLRLGGPLAGALGASYTALASALGMANVPYEVTLKILAPGFAEAVLLVGLGLFAGAVAVVGHWALEARIDRDVLKG
jgi:biopolymer transport protein ExbB/TolQ